MKSVREMKRFIITAEGYEYPLIFVANNIVTALKECCDEQGVGEDEIELIEEVSLTVGYKRKTEWVKV